MQDRACHQDLGLQNWASEFMNMGWKLNCTKLPKLTIKAHDQDTTKRIMYVMKQGPTDLFRIDEISGASYTTRGLDFERDNQHVLIIGTMENMSADKGSTTKVVVNVEDRNDIPSVFTLVPQPIALEDDVPIGYSVTNLIATDSDGTAPGNNLATGR